MSGPARHARCRLQKVIELMPDQPSLLALIATASALQLAAVAVVLTVSYLLSCRIWPYTNCGRCNGSGKSRSPLNVGRALGISRRKAFRNCPRCSGSGRRTRIGRRLLDHHRADR